MDSCFRRFFILTCGCWLFAVIRSAIELFFDISASVGTVFLGVTPERALVLLECEPELLVVLGTAVFG